MSLFTGAGVALVTPFHPDKSVNYEELTRLIEFQIKGGTDAIIICGTTGEPVTMTEDERLSVVAHAVKVTAGKLPVIAGSGGNCTESVVTFSKKCQDVGADGLLVVTPYYNKATQNGLYEHYKSVAKAVELPIIMYNVPSRTGVNLLPDTAVRLGKDFTNIVAVKEASGNISQVAELIYKARYVVSQEDLSNPNKYGNSQAEKDFGSCLDVYSGNDDQIVPILSLGGKGVISVLSNIAPKDTHDMVMEYLNGNVNYARELQLKYMDMIHALFCEVNPIPVKKALELMGFQTKELRMPLTEMEEANTARLKKEMKQLNIYL